MPHAVTATSDGKSYSYDCNGNLLEDGERAYDWDADNKPVAITRVGVGTTTFAYSGDGARVKKAGLAGTIRYVGGYEDHVTDGVQVKHIGVGGLRIATRVVGGSNAGVYYTHGDHLGSLNVLTNSSGAEVQRLTYLPYGETHTNTGAVDFHQRRYTGQEQDPETGLYFYQARYYNPALGRFISPDSIVPYPGDPQSLNRYSYVANNPVNRIDPSGHWSLKTLWSRVLRPWLRVEIPVGTVIACVVAGIFQQYWAIPLISALGSAATTFVNGGNFGQAALAGAIAAGASVVGMGVGAAVGGGLAAAGASDFVATVGGAVVGGAATGAFVAACYGGNVLQGMAIGAATAAASLIPR